MAMATHGGRVARTTPSGRVARATPGGQATCASTGGRVTRKTSGGGANRGTSGGRATRKTPTGPPVPRKPTGRRKRAKRRGGKGGSGRPPWQRVLIWGSIFGLGAAVLGGMTLAGLFIYYGADPALPNIQSVRDYKPNTVTRILDRNDILIGEV